MYIRQEVRHSVDKLEAALHELQIAVDGVAGDYKMKQTVPISSFLSAAAHKRL